MSTKPLNRIEASAFIEANGLNQAKLTDTAVDLTAYVNNAAGHGLSVRISIKDLSPRDGGDEFSVPIILPAGGIIKINKQLSSFRNISATGVLQMFEVELRTKTLHDCPATTTLKLTSCDTLESFEGAPATLIELHASFAADIRSFAGLPSTLKAISLDLFNNHSFSFEHLPDSIVSYELKELKTKPFAVKYPKSATDVGIDALNNVGELMLLPELKNIHYTGRLANDEHREMIIELAALMRRTSNPKARYYEAQQLLIEHDMDDFF